MSKTLLIIPPYHEVYSKVEAAEGVNQHLGLGYIASFLRKNKIEVSIWDANALRISSDNLEKEMPKDFDIIGVTASTPSINASLKILKIAKKMNPRCKTILGGPHVTALPVETMRDNPEVDFIVVGEGEETTLELVNVVEKREDPSIVKGIAYRNNGVIMVTAPRELIKNIDELPFPAYDLLPMRNYKQHLHHVGISKNIPTNFSILFTSRGCNYRCSFCASALMWRQNLRFRSVKNILGEVDMLIKNYSIRTFDIADDNFLLRNRKELFELLDGFEKRGIHFNCLSRVDTVDKEVLEKLKDAGCYLIRFGVESGYQEMLDRMHKGISVQQIKDAFELCKEVGIPASASFIIGHVGETKRSAEATIKLAKEIEPDLVHFFIAIPLPGTELYEKAREKKLIIDKEYEKWIQMPETPVMKTEELSVGEIVKLRSRAYKEFYMRPKYILRKLFSIRSFAQVKFYLRGLLAVRSLVK